MLDLTDESEERGYIVSSDESRSWMAWAQYRDGDRVCLQLVMALEARVPSVALFPFRLCFNLTSTLRFVYLLHHASRARFD